MQHRREKILGRRVRRQIERVRDRNVIQRRFDQGVEQLSNLGRTHRKSS